MANAVGSVFDPAASARSVLSTTRFYSANAGTDAPGYVLMSAVLTYVESNATIATTQLSGTLQAAQFPALTGDVTTTAGSLTTAIAAGVIVNADVNASAAIAVSKLAALTASRAMVTDASGFASASAVTATELGYVSGVTSAIQTQLNAKQASDTTLTALAAYNTNGLMTQTAADTFTGRTITGTANEITVTNGNGVSGNPTLSLATGIDATKIANGTVTSTEFQYLGSVTSDIQTQLNAKASTTQTLEGAGGLIGGTLSNTDYLVFLKMPHGGTITETTTKSTAGTGTATFKINTTALGLFRR